VKRGEIYVVDLGPGVGREASGVCPVVVLSSDVITLAPMLVVVVPAVDASDHRAVVGVVEAGAESGHPSDISVLARQPRALDPGWFPEQPSGRVPEALLKKIRDSAHSVRVPVPLHRGILIRRQFDDDLRAGQPFHFQSEFPFPQNGGQIPADIVLLNGIHRIPHATKMLRSHFDRGLLHLLSKQWVGLARRTRFFGLGCLRQPSLFDITQQVGPQPAVLHPSDGVKVTD
jgi:mRNA-degrading endonuclease toxin of MazEF toxin-antitoxin module